MIRVNDPYRPSHTTKPGHGEKFKPSGRSKMRAEWAEFCMEHCPHPDIVCGKRPCPEFSAKFGKVDNV